MCAAGVGGDMKRGEDEVRKGGVEVGRMEPTG
jgi:hypothetical protein